MLQKRQGKSRTSFCCGGVAGEEDGEEEEEEVEGEARVRERSRLLDPDGCGGRGDGGDGGLLGGGEEEERDGGASIMVLFSVYLWLLELRRERKG